MPLYRFVFEKHAVEIQAQVFGEAYNKLVDQGVPEDSGALVKVECGVSPFTSRYTSSTKYFEETWDEWRYRIEVDLLAENYEDVVSRLWINSRMDGSGYWIEMPHNYTNPAPRGADPTNAASIVEKYADEYWKPSSDRY